MSIFTCGNDPKICISACANLHKARWIKACRDPLFNVNSLVKTSVSLRTRIYTRFSKLLLVEIHEILREFAQAVIGSSSTSGNSYKIVYFYMRKNTQNCELSNAFFFSRISTCGNSVGKVFPHVNLWADKWNAESQSVQQSEIVRRQAKSRVFLMIKVATKVIIVLQGRKYNFIFGGKISDRSNRSYDPRKVTWGSNF